jgi:hypothetical protein
MTTMPRTTLPGVFAEKATLPLGATITDLDGVTPLPNADTVLTTLTMTLYEASTGVVINTCLARSLLNVNGGVVTAAGALTFQLAIADMACVTSAARELHIALLEWTWGSPAKSGKHEIAFTVANLLKVT